MLVNVLFGKQCMLGSLRNRTGSVGIQGLVTTGSHLRRCRHHAGNRNCGGGWLRGSKGGGSSAGGAKHRVYGGSRGRSGGGLKLFCQRECATTSRLLRRQGLRNGSGRPWWLCGRQRQVLICGWHSKTTRGVGRVVPVAGLHNALWPLWPKLCGGACAAFLRPSGILRCAALALHRASTTTAAAAAGRWLLVRAVLAAQIWEATASPQRWSGSSHARGDTRKGTDAGHRALAGGAPCHGRSCALHARNHGGNRRARTFGLRGHRAFEGGAVGQRRERRRRLLLGESGGKRAEFRLLEPVIQWSLAGVRNPWRRHRAGGDPAELVEAGREAGRRLVADALRGVCIGTPVVRIRLSRKPSLAVAFQLLVMLLHDVELAPSPLRLLLLYDTFEFGVVLLQPRIRSLQALVFQL
mmetsp:Transcript_111624/g.279548  ORF Transcript_111624/g.279548 Transcript_111624/m.279548 type:complete len:410 (-) Transcript_111624:247-1476(-)